VAGILSGVAHTCQIAMTSVQETCYVFFCEQPKDDRNRDTTQTA
jgi:hypothetical protein